MRSSFTIPSSILFLICIFSQQVASLITLDTIRDLTSVTDECRGRIEDFGGDGNGNGDGGREVNPKMGGGQGHEQQAVFLGEGSEGDDERDEVEIVLSATIHHLANHLWLELEKPLGGLTQDPLSGSECDIVIKQFHEFLKATTLFLYAVQEKQMKWRWRRESLVVDEVVSLQALWASRRTNIQDRSFIEQQLLLYRETTCFGKAINKEVLRRDVEVVEYLNDLLEMFE